VTRDDSTRGLLATAAAFGIWGFVPIYWKAVGAISPAEMIGWRVILALPFLAVLLWLTKGARQLRAVLGRPRLLGVLALSAALVGFNWFVFIDAVAEGRVMQASLGYYINPLVNVLLGFALLGERLRRLQWAAVALAAAGVATLVFAAGEMPYVALTLAITFGLYGLVRKLVPVDAVPGLFVEVLVMLLPAAIWLGVQASGPGLAQKDARLWLLLPLSGLITALPLSLFAFGARRLPLATVGILQFLAPTGQFLLATLAYGEAFTTGRVLTFVLIWAGAALYLVDLGRHRGRGGPTPTA